MVRLGGALVEQMEKTDDVEAIIALAQDTRAIVTVEEHQTAGGLGSAVAEVLAQNIPTAMEFLGVHDQYGQSGTPQELIEHYGMGVKSIVAAIRKVIDRK